MDNRFDWQSYLTTAYGSFPEAKRKPVIGLTGNYGELACKLNEGYYKSIWRAGGVPVIIPPIADTDVLINTLEHIDGLLLTGGADFNPLYAGEEPSPRLGGINAERDLPELLITQLAYNRQIPMLGICRGIQTLVMTLGGKVQQDISDVAQIRHSQDADRSEPTHSVTVEPDSTLFNIYKEYSQCSTFNVQRSTLFVNSFHHQAVCDPGERFRVTARSADGIIEAIESREYKSIIGVQWHPECMSAEDGSPIFSWLVQQAADYRRTCDLHQSILTLDTHCDTPMFFPQGVDFGSRDPRILVDLHKMSEGHQDATIMVCYLPQPQQDETFSSKVDFDVNGPTEYADLIFDKIEAIVEQNEQYLAIARTPADLYANKQQGRKSIMLGIENGLALDGHLERLQHFAQRGIVYMTLCHNGDNDICDSARGNHTHNGISSFGQQVVREMNRLGILVDLSHAGEKSFYDALEMSSQPIVCSHSSCRALCDHPRNLTDDQMRALAAKGGVMQITMYNGFLVKDGEATVLDALRHLEHAIEVMGIDHVGIGTDFDGDGGVRGMANSSELLNFTRLLLARGYSEQDIEKIWGGNFLRVMTQVQSVRE
jgi:microsomal dipeptidase-like Zn-dependent dipeptidase/anthranilate/para-aminobenzoate synthase component II